MTARHYHVEARSGRHPLALVVTTYLSALDAAKRLMQEAQPVGGAVDCLPGIPTWDVRDQWGSHVAHIAVSGPCHQDHAAEAGEEALAHAA